MEIKDALMARKGLYWKRIETAIAYERADWEKVNALVSETRMKEEKAFSLYASTVDWSTGLLRGATATVSDGRNSAFRSQTAR